MAPEHAFQLKHYVDRRKYDEVCRSRFGRTYDLAEAELSVQDLRLPGHPLRASHVAELFNTDCTHFGHFWKPPGNLEHTLDPRRISLARPSEETEHWRRTLVAVIFEHLGSEEAASVLLRSVHPEEFAVYSPPLLNLLQLPAQPPVEHYLSYCEELRVWGAHFGTGTVGATDHALWMFYEWAYGPAGSSMEDPHDRRDARARRSAFENDRWVRERQAMNVLRPFFSKWSTLDQAACLADIDANLAGKIAGCEFEARLRRATGLEREDVPSLILAFSRQVVSDPTTQRRRKQRLRKAWKLRNRSVHTGSALGAADVHALIETIRELFPADS